MRRDKKEGWKLSTGEWADAPGKVLSVCHPDWRGVRAAAYSQRGPVLETSDAAAHAADIIDGMAQTDMSLLVLQGFPPGSSDLLRAAHNRGLSTRVVLHSSMAQHGVDPGEAAVVEAVLGLADEGAVDKVGFVKKGQAEAFTALGHAAHYVPNRTPQLPPFEPVSLGGSGLQVGVFAEPIWRKNVTTQLGAIALMPSARAHLMTMPGNAYLSSLEVVAHGELPYADFVQLQGSVDLNLYVSLSECQPMSPLESYLASVPCLMSRTSDLFRSDADLWRLTSVGEIDDPSAIAAAAAELLANQAEAVERARAWMDHFDPIAQSLWEDFVG